MLLCPESETLQKQFFSSTGGMKKGRVFLFILQFFLFERKNRKERNKNRPTVPALGSHQSILWVREFVHSAVDQLNPGAVSALILF
jgi:hypothetical protein